MATIFSVGDGDSVDLIGPQEVQSPPRIFISLCVGTGSLKPVTSTASVDGPFRDGLPVQGGLSNFSTFSNINNWTKQYILLLNSLRQWRSTTCLDLTNITKEQSA